MNFQEYKYEKIDETSLPLDHTFYVFGDNLLESMQIIEWLKDFNESIILKSVKYISLCRYCYVCEINGELYYFIARSYFHDGKLPNAVVLLISNIDKPDAIIYSPFKKKVLFGFESTSSTLAGNATWQRTGRTMEFLNKKIPFGFLAYSSKLDQSDSTPGKKPRKASDLFVLLYLLLSVKYSSPALVGFYRHDDPQQSIGFPNIDYRSDLFKYVLSHVLGLSSERDDLIKCYENMCSYYDYSGVVKQKEFSSNLRKMILSQDFPKRIVDAIESTTLFNFFDDMSICYDKWKVKGNPRITDVVFDGIDIYRLSKHCKAGITFDTEKLIDLIDSKNKVQSVMYLQEINEPTIIIPICLTKIEKEKLVPTDDPYNGEISAFSEMYRQSYPKANILLLLLDHSNSNEYDVLAAKTRKVYKSIQNYANILMDIDFNIFDKNSTYGYTVNQSKFNSIKVTEDSVTCFFGTLLEKQNKKISFINPPCGSWSDLRLYPTSDFYYYKRNDVRADIAYHDNGIYFIGESKDYYTSLKNSISNEYDKVTVTKKLIQSNLKIRCDYKLFCLFYGTVNDAEDSLINSSFDYSIAIEDDDENIYVRYVTR